MIKDIIQLGYRNPPVPANNVTEDKPLDLSALPPPDHGEGDEFGSVPQHINPSSCNNDDDSQLIKDSMPLGYRNPPVPANNVTEDKPLDLSALPPPDHGEGDEFGSVPQHINPSSCNNDDDSQLIKDSMLLGYRNPPVPANNVTEDKPLDLSALPPPDFGEGDEFGSVPQHINPSSCNDDDDSQLIKDSMLLGYRNPPEAKSQVKPSIRPRADPTGYPGGYRPPDWLPPTSLSYGPAVASPNRDDRFDNTHVEVSRQQSQHQHVNARGLGNELGYGNTRPPNMVPPAVFPDDTPKAGGLRSLPSVTVSTVYKRQASIPNDTSLSGGSERMAGIATSTTTNSNQLAVSDSSPVIAPVPITDQPPEASQAPPDSKYGKTNLNVLKNRLQHKKEVTQTVFQTGGPAPHSQSTSDYAEIPYQRISESTTTGKTDLTVLRNKLEKAKKEKEKAMSDKRPMGGPQTTRSASSSKITYRLWQCAYCQTVNEAHHTSCEHCKLPLGRITDGSYLCEFCQLMIFIPLKKKITDTCCPRCKQVYESAL